MSSSKTTTGVEPESAAAEQAARYLKVGAPVGIVALALIGGFVQGPSIAILVLAGGALIAVIATFWSSVRTLFGETPLSGADAYALGAPRAEEEQKQAVLRALKDLEFERSVGKISEEDYKELVAKYRAEAKRLLRILDEDAQPRRDHVEALVAKRLRREGLLNEAAGAEEKDEEVAPARRDEEAAAPAEVAGASAGKKKRGAQAKAAARNKKKGAEAAAASVTDAATATDAEAVTEAATGAAAAVSTKAAAEAAAEPPPAPANAGPTTLKCAACSAVNDSDAAFCKKCGARLTSDTSEPAKEAADDKADAAKTTEDGAGT